MNYSDKITRRTANGKMVVLNADRLGCCVTMTTAHHYGGNIISPRQGFREMGVLVIDEKA